MAKRERPRAADRRPEAPLPEDETGESRRDRLRRRLGDGGPLTRGSVLLDLEVAKHLAFEEGNLAVAVRAAVEQGRAVGARRELDRGDAKRLSDEQLIKAIAGENGAFAGMLRQRLQTGRPPPAPTDEPTA